MSIDIGGRSAAALCHTTGHAGPHTAVPRIKLVYDRQPWTAYLIEICRRICDIHCRTIYYEACAARSLLIPRSHGFLYSTVPVSIASRSLPAACAAVTGPEFQASTVSDRNRSRLSTLAGSRAAPSSFVPDWFP